jgi:hypothetical protein
MSVEWLGLSKLIPAGTSAAKSIYDRIIGKSPRLNFDTDSGGIQLHVFNTRDETIIIERIEASPPLLGFSTEQPIAVLSPGEKASVKVITFDPFDDSDQTSLIKVRVYWRTAKRQMFSRSSVASKIAVRDIKDLTTAVDKKQPWIG